MRKRIVSGMRPTGKMHLGHLLGALGNWKSLQEEYECFYFVADWHALTSEYGNAGIIRESIHDMVIDWIASGLDYEASTFFIQSEIKEHLELHLIFSMITPLPWLERNPTYKDQLRELAQKDLYTYGFLGYPVLQAADILMYKANGVPVGEDQAPHVELTREIARRFNHMYKPIFPEPATLLAPTSKLLGIDRRKMSKSYDNAIFMSDNDEDVTKKVLQMITDPQRARKKDPGDPKVCNVFSFHEMYTPEEMVKQIDHDCRTAGIGCWDCKNIMAGNLCKALAPVREKREKLAADSTLVDDIIAQGNKKAKEISSQTMVEVKEAIGL